MHENASQEIIEEDTNENASQDIIVPTSATIARTRRLAFRSGPPPGLRAQGAATTWQVQESWQGRGAANAPWTWI